MTTTKISKGVYQGTYRGVTFEIDNVSKGTWAIYFDRDEIDARVFDLDNDRVWTTKDWALRKAKQYIEEL